MPNEDNKILQYNYGEKPLKVPVIIYAEKLVEKKCTHVKIILKNPIQRKKLLLFIITHCLQIVHMMQ